MSLRYTFLFLDGQRMQLTADDCKHYSGHAALTNVVDSDGRHYKRLNVGLYGLRLMFTEEL